MDSNPPPYSASAAPPASNTQLPPGAAYYQPYPPHPVGGYSQPYPQYNYPAPGAATGPPPPAQTQQPKPVTTTTIVINATGNCSTCRIGNVQEKFTMAGICCAIWFFPFGLICCMSWKIRSCDHCGTVY